MADGSGEAGRILRIGEFYSSADEDAGEERLCAESCKPKAEAKSLRRASDARRAMMMRRR